MRTRKSFNRATQKEVLLTECPVCGDPRAEALEGGAVVCTTCSSLHALDEDKRESVRRKLTGLGLLTGKPAGMRFDTFDTTERRHRRAYDLVKAWIQGWPHEDGESLMLWSSNFGAGKTHLARATQFILVSAGVQVVFCPLAEVLSQIRSSYGKRTRQEPEADIVAPYRDAALLIIDDLGKAHVTESGRPWFHDIMYRLIDHRSDRCLPIFITSNRHPEELADLIGGAAASRLHLMLGPRIADVSGPDWRLK